MSSPAAIAALTVVDLGQARLRAGDLALGQRGQRPVAGELDGQQVDGDLAQALADLGVAAGVGVGGDGAREAVLLVAHALRAQADGHALEHQRGQRGAPAVVDLADDRVGGQAHVVEEDLVELGLAGDLAQAADGDALGVHRQDEHRQALVLVLLGVGARQQQAVGGELRVGGPHLLAVEHPACRRPPGARASAPPRGPSRRPARRRAGTRPRRRGASARGSAPSAPRCRGR